MSIEEALLEIEAQQFIGRRGELTMIEQLLERARCEALVAYAYGPRGVGKTAFLRASQRAAQHRGSATVEVSASAEDGFEGLIRQIAQALAFDAACATPEMLIPSLAAMARENGLLLVIDDYDTLDATEMLVRTRLLYRLPEGILALLSGRRPPAALWPLERTWRSFVERLPLSDLPPGDARRLLAFHGVEDGTVQQEALTLTGGRPALLAQVADVLSAEREVAVGAQMELAAPEPRGGVQDFILEQLIHPGSRRAAWRAESALDAEELVLQAASLLPYFNRALLSAMLGEEITQIGWDILERLPGSIEAGNWHRLDAHLSRAVEGATARERPWLRQVWLGRAIRRLVTADERRGQIEEALALRLLYERRRPGLSCPGLVINGPEGLALAERLLEAPWLRTICILAPDRLWVLRDESGTARGAAVMTDASALPAGGAARIRVPQEATLCVVAARDACAVGSLLGLLAVAARSGGDVVVHGIGAARGACEMFGLRPIGEEFYLLESQIEGGRDWLTQLAERSLAAVPATDRSALAKEVLQAFSAGTSLVATRAGAVYRARVGQSGEAEMRQWLLDALRSAELGDPSLLRRRLLRLYYLDKVGSHEDIAERLDLPRASYFRAYREALAAFGAALCGVF